MRTRKGDVEDRFFDRFEKDSSSGCWNWTAHTNSKGYGVIAGLIRGKRYGKPGIELLAHRVSWILHNGEIPEGDGYHGTVVMHKCDNPLCVNPDHLQLGTLADNVQDMMQKGRGKTARGFANPGAKMPNPEAIHMIRSTPKGTRGLAKMFGVSKETIALIRNGERYAHI